MIPYIYFYLIEFFLLFAAVASGGRQFWYMSVFISIIFSGFRYNVGVDYSNYFIYFSSIGSEAITLYEPATVIISKLLFFFPADVWIVFIVYSFFTILGISFFLRKFSPNPELSFFLFLTIPIYYLATFNGVRQWCAISLFSVSLVFLLEKKNIKMFFALLFAAMFHMSAFFMFILIPFLKHNYSFKFLIFTGFIVILMSPFFLDLIYLTKYRFYLDQISFNNSPSFVFWLYLFLLPFLPYSLGYFNQGVNLKKSEIILCNICLFSLFLLLVGYRLGIDFLVFMRLNNFLIISLPVLVVFFIDKLTLSIRRFILTLVVLFSLSYLSLTLIVNGEKYKLMPYEYWDILGVLAL